MAKQYVCIDDLHIDWDFTDALKYADRIATYDAGMKRVLDELEILPKFTKKDCLTFVLDEIRAEIDQYLFQNEFGSEYRKEVSQIINKYKAESEE